MSVNEQPQDETVADETTDDTEGHLHASVPGFNVTPNFQNSAQFRETFFAERAKEGFERLGEIGDRTANRDG